MIVIITIDEIMIYKLRITMSLEIDSSSFSSIYDDSNEIIVPLHIRFFGRDFGWVGVFNINQLIPRLR